MPKQIDSNQFQQLSVGVKPELFAKCFNNETTLSNKTKLVIVGTLTPPNTSYFYCSYLNRIYGYIDEALKDTKEPADSLKKLKIGLSKYKTIPLASEEIIKERVQAIKNILKDNHIAFLDVMEKAIRRKVSPYDEDIQYFVLAQKDFDRIPPDAIVIANSRLAYECAVKLNINNINYLSQRCEKKEKWVDIIKTALI